MTHTPWQWIVESVSGLHHEQHIVLKKGAKYILAPVYTHAGKTFVRVSKDHARLIAAAPDYDDAARCFIRWIESYGDQLDPSILGAMECAFGGKLRAATAKVTQ